MDRLLDVTGGERLSAQSRYVLRRVVDQEPFQEARVRLVGRRALKVVGLVVVNGGKGPFVPISLKLGGDNRVYGGALAYGNLTSFAAIGSILFLTIVDEELRPLSPEELEMLGDRSGCCGKTMRLGGCVVVGLGAQVSMAYMAYKYNDDSLALAGVVFFCESVLPIYSVWSSVEEVRYRRSLEGFEKKLFGIRQQICGMLGQNEAALPNLSVEKRKDFLLNLRLLKNGTSVDAVQSALKLLLNPVAPVKRASGVRIWGRRTVYLVGATFTAGQLLFNGRLGQEAASDAVGNDSWYTYVAGAAVGGCMFKFLVDGIYFTAGRVYDRAVDRFEGKKSLGYAARPYVHNGLNLVAYATAGLSYGPTIEGTKDVFSGYLSNTEQVLCGAGVVLLAIFGLTAVVDKVTESSAKNLTREEIGELVQLSQALRKLRVMYKKSPLLELAKHLKEFPEDLQGQLLAKVDSSIDELNSYLRKNVVERL